MIPKVDRLVRAPFKWRAELRVPLHFINSLLVGQEIGGGLRVFGPAHFLPLGQGPDTSQTQSPDVIRCAWLSVAARSQRGELETNHDLGRDGSRSSGQGRDVLKSPRLLQSSIGAAVHTTAASAGAIAVMTRAATAPLVLPAAVTNIGVPSLAEARRAGPMVAPVLVRSGRRCCARATEGSGLRSRSLRPFVYSRVAPRQAVFVERIRPPDLGTPKQDR